MPKTRPDGPRAVDPFRATAGDRRPSLEAVAQGILKDRALVEHLLHRLSWTDPEDVAAVAEILVRRMEETTAARAALDRGIYGRTIVATGVVRIDITEISGILEADEIG